MTGMLWLGTLALPPAMAGAKRELKAHFSTWQALIADFDPGVGALYSPEALVHTVRTRADGQQQTLSLDGEQWQELLVQVMPEARELNDRDRYDDVVYTKEGDSWRITASRYNELKCYTDTAFFQVLAQDDTGAWRITEEFTGTQELSQCPDAGSKLDQVLEIQRRSLSAHVPLQIDAETVLQRVSVEGSTLSYHFGLIRFTVADLDLEAFGQGVAGATRTSSCATADTRLLLDLGATLHVIYQDSDGVQVYAGSTVPADCATP